MTLIDRAREHGRQAELEFIAGAAEAGERLLAAVALMFDGAVVIPADLLVHMPAAATYTVAATDGGVVVRYAEDADLPDLPPPAPAETRAERAQEPQEPLRAVDAADDPQEEELSMEDTTEAREARYLARHRGGRARAAAGVQPARRARVWDEPEDLAFQEEQGAPPDTVTTGRDEAGRDTGLTQGDGSVYVGMR